LTGKDTTIQVFECLFREKVESLTKTIKRVANQNYQQSVFVFQFVLIWSGEIQHEASL